MLQIYLRWQAESETKMNELPRSKARNKHLPNHKLQLQLNLFSTSFLLVLSYMSATG